MIFRNSRFFAEANRTCRHVGFFFFFKAAVVRSQHVCVRVCVGDPTDGDAGTLSVVSYVFGLNFDLQLCFAFKTLQHRGLEMINGAPE